MRKCVLALLVVCSGLGFGSACTPAPDPELPISPLSEMEVGNDPNGWASIVGTLTEDTVTTTGGLDSDQLDHDLRSRCFEELEQEMTASRPRRSGHLRTVPAVGAPQGGHLGLATR